MTLFLGLGIAGLVLLALALVFDGFLEGVLGGAAEGAFGGLVSLPAIAGFVSMLGFCAAAVQGATGLGTTAAVLSGVVAGVVTAWLVVRLSRLLMRDQTDPVLRSDDLVGAAGSVVTPIPAGGYGEVMLHLTGQPVKYAARSAEPVPRGAEVWVAEVLSTTSVEVRPVER
ncbi:NfeD family protein [Streptomyces sp. NPDC059506]|uniref:NfeD-like C-terminal domain-containing protein n=1 Tax=Streptomyces thermolineatus TaxID=44033 RepID=A0ABN3MZ41_9ACTN|nr:MULTISPECIES: NfeD family protein [unclassified Streptomyces]MCZ2525987.1 hypothetical protein [Streptomyces sp. HB2AG]PLW72587.1 hypothetical protein C0036_11830 [Streptomyces sp. DJ]QMV22977.1 hypothetical protein GQS52_15670 [Streptomyces sp. SCUT-3]